MGNALDSAAVRNILLDSWDPVGVSGLLAAENEYDRFVPEMLELLQHANVRQLAQHLHRLETNVLGLTGDTRRCLRTAQRLHHLHEHPGKPA